MQTIMDWRILRIVFLNFWQFANSDLTEKMKKRRPQKIRFGANARV